MSLPSPLTADAVDWSRVLRPVAAGEFPLQVPADLPHSDLVPDHIDEAAVLVPLWSGDEGLEIVFTQRTRRLRRHGGQISFPGGRIESQDRTRLQAALRETEEEVGIGAGQVQPIGCLDPIFTVTGYAVIPFVGMVDEAAQMRACPREVAEIFTVPLSFLLEPGNCRTESAWFKGRLREFYVFPYRDYHIWGATAAMLVDLLARIRDGSALKCPR